MNKDLSYPSYRSYKLLFRAAVPDSSEGPIYSLRNLLFQHTRALHLHPHLDIISEIDDNKNFINSRAARIDDIDINDVIKKYLNNRLNKEKLDEIVEVILDSDYIRPRLNEESNKRLMLLRLAK